MFFNKKEDTNIDKEFNNNNKKNNIYFKKMKPILLITGGIILVIILILIVILLLKNSSKYKIKLYGEERITLTLGSNYIEPGYVAYDKSNNDITDQVEVTSNVDTSKIGTYEVLYSIENVNKVRYITIIETIDETYIRLNGDITMYLEVGETYTEPGYQVYDSIDKNLSEQVKVNGTVESSKVGTYQITYSVVNSRDVTTTVKRTIIVVEKGKKN